MAVCAVNFLVIPIATGLAALRAPLIRLLFERGAFDANATTMTATALLYLAPGLFAYGLRDIFARAFYALQDTITPMINSGITIGANILLLFLLVPRYGLVGLAGATSLSGIAGGLLLLVALRRKLGRIGGKEIFASMLKILSAALAMGLAARLLYPPAALIMPGHGFIKELGALATVGAACAIVYFGLLRLLRARELQIVLSVLRRGRMPGEPLPPIPKK
jgi:putative peptidoglycan lipid II flippase